jgi:hypothetical protein
LIGFFVGFEAMNATRDAHAAKGFSPSDGIRLVAGRRRKAARHSCPAADKAVNLFFDVDEWLFHAAKAYVFNRGNASGATKIYFNHTWTRINTDKKSPCESESIRG